MMKRIHIKNDCDIKQPSPARLVYILAASHSGSTLLAMLLGAHTQIATVGELKATNLGDIHRYRCSCGVPIQQCEFWNHVRQHMMQEGFSFDLVDAGTDFFRIPSRYVRYLLKPLVRGTMLETMRDLALNLSPTWRTILPVIQNQNLALIRTLCNLTNARIIVDSSKIGLRLKYLLAIPELDIKIVHLVRDGRAVAMTYTDPAGFADSENPAFHAGGMGGNRDTEKKSIRQAAWEWRRSNEEARAILSRISSNRQIEIHYEQLCREPHATLDAIFKFIGVEPQDTVKTFRDKTMHVLGNGMRLDTSSEIKLDQRWIDRMTPNMLLQFDAIAGTLNHRYGYGQSDGWENS
jgi:hypothetical protein